MAILRKLFTNILKALPFMLIGVLIGLNAYKAATGDTIPEAYYGKPSVFVQEEPVNARIDQVAGDGRRIYVLPNDNAGLLQIYGIDGEYQSSVAFQSHMNGGFKIAVREHKLYVSDKRNNLYIFSNGEYSAFVPWEDGRDLWESVDFEGYSSEYTIKAGSVYEKTGTGEVCRIQGVSRIFSTFIPLAILLCALVMAVRVVQMERKKEL